MKRALLVIVFILITAGIGYALYLFFFAAPPVEVPEVNVNVPPVVGLPPAVNAPPPRIAPPINAPALPPGVSAIADGGVTVVTPVAPVATIGASISLSGQLNYYNRSDGKFYRLNPDGTTSSLSNKQFFNVSNSKFDAQGNKAIIEYPDGSNIMYNFANGQQVTLPRHWENFDFSPSGDKIVAKSVGIDPDSRFIVVANPDGSGTRAIQEMGANQDKVQISWSPSNESVAFGIGTTGTSRYPGGDAQEVVFVGLQGQQLKPMTVEGQGFRPLWNPSGQQLLYSVASSASNYKPLLWIVDAQGDNIGRNRRSIAVNTWADKCTFASSDTVYCAVPTELPTGAGLLPAIADQTPDNIYKINLNTGLQTRVAIPEGSHTIGKMMLTPDKKTLYFSDKSSGTLNKIQLAQ